MPRYVLGPSLGPLSYSSSPTPPADKTDVIPEVVSATPKEIVLSYRAYDPEAEQAPVATHAYLLPEGNTAPEDGQGWIDSLLPNSFSDLPVGPGGDPAYKLPPPVAPLGNYAGQVILEFPD